jgi:phage terminase large subunit-like protein
VTWPNGSHATIYSDEVPDQLRGFSGDTAWLDEMGKWRNPQDTWDNLQFGMREKSTDRPRCLITTTPRPIPIMRYIERLDTTKVVTGSTYDNYKNLDPKWYQDVVSRYEGTRLGRQELHAEYLDDMPGALWTRAMLDDAVYSGDRPEFVRTIVAVDPSGASGDEDTRANSIGIICASKGADGYAYVRADRTCSMSPGEWAKRVADTYHVYGADRIIAEKNFGGAMVEHTLRSVDPNLPISVVTADRNTGGKSARAEPIAALYEQRKVRHLGMFAELEDQMILMLPEGFQGKGSPDRVDALVWALRELMLPKGPQELDLDFSLVSIKVPKSELPWEKW